MNNDVDNNDQDYLDESTWSDNERGLTHERVRELFDYDSQQGLLIWKERPVEDFKREQDWKSWNTRFCGKVFGTIKIFGKNKTRPHKRRYGTYSGKMHLHYRLVWLYHNKKAPKILDHIDQNPLNDKIENLRPSSPVHNQRNTKMRVNNTSGITGIYWVKRDNKWCSKIMVKGKYTHLGYFTDKQDAIKARKEAELKYDFDPSHGKLKEESTS